MSHITHNRTATVQSGNTFPSLARVLGLHATGSNFSTSTQVPLGQFESRPNRGHDGIDQLQDQHRAGVKTSARKSAYFSQILIIRAKRLSSESPRPPCKPWSCKVRLVEGNDDLLHTTRMMVGRGYNGADSSWGEPCRQTLRNRRGSPSPASRHDAAHMVSPIRERISTSIPSRSTCGGAIPNPSLRCRLSPMAVSAADAYPTPASASTRRRLRLCQQQQLISAHQPSPAQLSKGFQLASAMNDAASLNPTVSQSPRRRLERQHQPSLAAGPVSCRFLPT
ncbi:hypothetical protein FPV67DRAFT_1445188 [Lyophyllum atratum]|nr:hypothetical protein FPV67DRAFT_1445188 [Lyophyllum atratum]